MIPPYLYSEQGNLANLVESIGSTGVVGGYHRQRPDSYHPGPHLIALAALGRRVVLDRDSLVQRPWWLLAGATRDSQRAG